jgi:hypothetical protein
MANETGRTGRPAGLTCKLECYCTEKLAGALLAETPNPVPVTVMV